MREFSQQIRVVPIGELSATYGGTASELGSLGTVFQADDFVFDPVSSTSSGGSSLDCNMEHIIDIPVHNSYPFPTPAIVVYKTSDGGLVKVGTVDVPARVQIVPHLNKARLIIRCTALKPPF